MPKHVRSIECCYCGAATLVNLRDANDKSLKCGECGAGMAVGKMALLSESSRPVTSFDASVPVQSAPALAQQWQEKRGKRSDDGRPKRPKRKKKKGFFDRLEDIWDEVEDIFD